LGWRRNGTGKEEGEVAKDGGKKKGGY